MRKPEQFRQQPAGGGGEHGNEQIIFHYLPSPVLVHGHALRVFLSAPSQPADELVQRAERTQPAAKEPAQQNRQRDREQRPEQAGVNFLRGEQRAQRHQWIELQQPVHRPAA